LTFDPKNYLIHFKTRDILVVDGTVNIDGITIPEDKFDHFLKLIDLFNVKAIISNVIILEEIDLIKNTINPEELEEKFIIPSIIKEVKEHNDKLIGFLKYIGQELMIDLSFAYQGLVYEYNWENDIAYEFSKLEFFRMIQEEYADEIEANQEQFREIRRLQYKEFENKVRDYVMKDDYFLSRTNANLRRAYIHELMEVGKELEPPSGSFISANGMLEVVEGVWREMKLKKKL
jgi:hypothetical protein